jgi:hypothetical protein
LIDVIAVLAKTREISGEPLQIRLRPAGVFQVDVMGLPALCFDGHIARPMAVEFERIARDIADKLRLEFEPLIPEGEPATPDDDLDFGM